jgi:hypothetical protein
MYASLLFYGRRHGGSDGSGSQEVDLAIPRDPALTVKPENRRSRPNPEASIVYLNY